MIAFDKYKKYGAYHWAALEGGSLRKTAERCLPLLARYEICLDRIPKRAELGVDIGCGDGALTYLMAERGECRRVVGFDEEPEAIDLARQKVATLPLGGTTNFVCAPFNEASCPPGSVDVAILADVIEHLEDPSGLLHIIKKAGRAGGRLILTTPRARKERLWDDRHVREYTEETLKELLSGVFLPRQIQVHSFMPLFLYYVYRSVLPVRWCLNYFYELHFNALKTFMPGFPHGMLLGVCEFS